MGQPPTLFVKMQKPWQITRAWLRFITGGDGGELNPPSRERRPAYPTSLVGALLSPGRTATDSVPGRLADSSLVSIIGVLETALRHCVAVSQPTGTRLRTTSLPS